MKKEEIICEAYLLSEEMLSLGLSPKVEYYAKYSNFSLYCFNLESECIFQFHAKLGNSNTRAYTNLLKEVRNFKKSLKQVA